MQLGKVMIVDDSPSLRALLVSTLIREGYDVYSASSIANARAALQSFRPNLVTLDLTLEDGDGSDLLQEIRKAGALCLVLTARDGDEERMRLLELGAQEYLHKPVSAQEILLRIRNILSFLKTHLIPEASALIEIGGIKIDLTSRCIVESNGAKTVGLTSSEVKFLTILGAAGEVATNRDRLYTQITGKRNIGESRALDMLASKLRGKLRDAGSPTDIYWFADKAMFSEVAGYRNKRFVPKGTCDQRILN